MRHVIPISGKDSLATALVMLDRHLPFELYFNDVGAELPETYAWLDLVEKTLNLPMTRVGVSLVERIAHHNMLPSAGKRFCTKETKIQPMERYFGDDEVTVYFGIRADEQRAGYKTTKDNITCRYPLVEEGIGLEQVLKMVDACGLRPPRFLWRRLKEAVMRSMTDRYEQGTELEQKPDEVITSLPAWFHDQLFAWRSRSNCYFCFFQRMYEWAGLLEHHPDLFDEAERIERETGAGRVKDEFTWVQGFPLRLVRKHAEVIFKKRVQAVIKEIGDYSRNRHRLSLDVLDAAGCGLFCGK